MVDIALDPNMYYRTMSTVRTLYKAAELGFEYVELSPNADFHFWHHRPAADDAFVAELNKAQKETGVKVRVERPKSTTHRFDHLIDPVVVVMYTESGVRIDDEVNVNLQYAYSIECELVLETAAVRLGDQERIHIRDIHGNRNAMCQSHIDRFEAAFNREVQEWINAVARDEHTGSTSWDGYAATSVVDAAVASLEDESSPMVDVELIAKPAFYA